MYLYIYMCALPARTRQLHPALRLMIETQQEDGAGNDRNPAQAEAHQHNRRNWVRVGRVLDAEEFGSQQKLSPEEGTPERGPIPLHRETTLMNVDMLTPPTHTAADAAHSARSTQPALRPHRTTTQRVGDKTNADAPFKRSKLTPLGGPRPRYSPTNPL